MARLEWKNNQRDLALNRLRSAHMLRPDYLDLYLEYAQYLIWTKNYVEALALLEKAHLYHNKSDQLRLLTAYSHFKLNNQKKFSQDIKEAIALNPQNAEIYAVLSELWYEKRKPASEIQFLTEKAIALNSENKNVKPLLAWSLLQQDQLTQAVALFEEFYDQNPTEVFYSESLADIYARNTLPIKTLDYQDKVVELKMQNQLKNEIDYFSNQNQVQKTDSQNVKSRLPASLDQ
jgi:cytochrome c-type biogenesis protein CcmH/NrfG